MATIETHIDQALRTRVAGLTGYSIDYGDANFALPVTGGVPQPFLTYANNPNRVERIGIRSRFPHRRQGILQITLCYPIALAHGLPVILEKAGLIAARFPDDQKMKSGSVSVRVTEYPTIAAPYRDDAYWRVPVNIRWETFA